MGAKITALIVTMAANIAAGVAILFFMLIAMNGYSESDATWGLGAYALLAIVVTALTGLGAFFVTGRLLKKDFHPVACSLIAITVFTILGVVLEIVCSFIGVGVAELVRVSF